ncbi:MAG: hypothetical protein M0033_02865 [Nitrospiraceae bacterium]|nr:hypothetical protein [Nitrospiraceae bacterium]
MPDPATATPPTQGVNGAEWYDDVIRFTGDFARKQITKGLESGLDQASKPLKMGFDKALDHLEDEAAKAGSPAALEEINHQIEVIRLIKPELEKDCEDFAHFIGKKVIEEISPIRLKDKKAATAGDLGLPPVDLRFTPAPLDWGVSVRPDWESIISKDFLGELKEIDLDFDAEAFAKYEKFEWQKYMKRLSLDGKAGFNLQIESFNATAAATAGVDLAKDTFKVGAGMNAYWHRWTCTLEADWSYNFREGEVADWKATLMFSLNPWGSGPIVQP